MPTPPDAPMTSTLSPALMRAGIAQSLEGSPAGDRDHRRLLEGEAGRLVGELVLEDGRVLGV